MTPIPRRLLRAVTHSLDTPEELAPHIEAIFQRLPALGAMPRRSATLLARHFPTNRTITILDAACGKGAVSIELAKRTRCRITAFDAYPPFIESAKAAAQRAGVAPSCDFVCHTAEAFFKRPAAFDAAMMLNLWPAQRAATALRKVVRPNGVYLIDDATLDPTAPGASRFDHMPTLEEATSDIGRTGDVVLACFRPTPTMIRRQNDTLFRRIKASTHDLLGIHPHLAKPVRELLRRQTEANRLLTGPLRSTLWVIRRGR